MLNLNADDFLANVSGTHGLQMVSCLVLISSAVHSIFSARSCSNYSMRSFVVLMVNPNLGFIIPTMCNLTVQVLEGFVFFCGRRTLFLALRSVKVE